METEMGHLKPLPETLTRRGFVAASLGASVTLAAAAVRAQTVIHTDAAGLVAGEVKVPAAGGDIPAYRAMPASGGPFPTVLVIEEISGLGDYIEDVCRRLAKLGYFAVVPELFSRQGGLAAATSQQQAVQMLGATPDASTMADLDATQAWAKASGKADTARLAVTGFCLGGRVTWLYAEHNPGLKAAVSWYGFLTGQVSEIKPKTPLDLVADLKCPVLGLYGGKDPGNPAETIERMKQAAAAAGKKIEFVVYPEAGHGFHSDYRPAYVKSAAEDGWKRLQAWFKQ